MLRLFLLLVVTLTCPSLQAASIAHTIDTERTTIKLSWRLWRHSIVGASEGRDG